MTHITTMMWSPTYSQTPWCVKSSRPQEALPRTKLVFRTKLGDGIPANLFQTLKDDTVKVLNSICPQNWKTQHWPQYWKRSVFIPIPKKCNAKEYSNYCTIALISYANNFILKILQARLQQYMNSEQSGFRRGRGTRDQIINIHWIIKKGNFRKIFASLTTLKPLMVWITTNW